MKRAKKIASIFLAICLLVVTTYCAPFKCYAAEKEDEFPYYASVIDGEDLKDEPYAIGNNLDYCQSGNILKVVGTTVNSHGNTWAIIEQYNGQIGYIYNANLEKTDVSIIDQSHFPSYAAVKNLNKDLKSAPYAASSNIKNLLNVGEVVIVDSTCINSYGNEWAHVQLISGEEGYFYYGDLQEIDCQDVYECKSKINIHAGPASSYEVLEKDVLKGTMFKYISFQTNQYGNIWYCVEDLTSGTVGYVYGDDLMEHTHDFQTSESVSICRKCGYYTENDEGITRLSAAVGAGSVGGFLDLGVIGNGLEFAGQIHPVVAIVVVGMEIVYISHKLSKAGTYDYTIEKYDPYDTNKFYDGYHPAKTINEVLYISTKSLSREEALKLINTMSKVIHFENNLNGIYTASEEQALLLCKDYKNNGKFGRGYYKDCSHAKTYMPAGKCFYFDHYHLSDGILFENSWKISGKKIQNLHIWFGLPKCPGENNCGNDGWYF